MTTVDDILAHVKWMQENKDAENPIFQIMLIENPDTEMLVTKYGEQVPSGFPDSGDQYRVGYYYSISDAVHTVENNVCDIQETCYNAAFVLCLFPGLYSSCTKDERMYFVWDEDIQKFVPKEESGIFYHVAY